MGQLRRAPQAEGSADTAAQHESQVEAPADLLHRDRAQAGAVELPSVRGRVSRRRDPFARL